jgi:hypothetical protein
MIQYQIQYLIYGLPGKYIMTKEWLSKISYKVIITAIYRTTSGSQALYTLYSSY